MIKREFIDPEDTHLFRDPSGDPQVVDGIAVFQKISDQPGAPNMPHLARFVADTLFTTNGAAHADLRARLSALLEERFDAIADDPPFNADEMAHLQTAETVNIVDDMVQPISRRMIERYIALPDDVIPYLNAINAIETFSDVRLGRLKKFDGAIGEIYAATASDPEKQRYLTLVSVLLTTRHTAIGAFARTLDAAFAENPEGRLDTLRFPWRLTHSALSFLTRVAPRDLQGRARAYQAGVPYRCPINTDIGTQDDNAFPSFGEPPRSCLGRTLSFLVWREAAKALQAAIDARIAAGQTRYTILSRVEVPRVGSCPIGGDLRFE